MINKKLSGIFLKYYYNKNFSIVEANTKELKEICYNIRYKVFYEEKKMIEKKYVNEETFTECNDDDENSTQFLIYDKKHTKYIGTIRVVNIKGVKAPPALRNFSDSINMNLAEENNIIFDSEVEISRVSVLKSERFYERKKSPPPSLFLYLYAGTYIYQNNHKRSIAIMNSALNSHLNKLGIKTIKIGKDVNLFGKRSIYIVDIKKYHDNFPPLVKPICKTFLRLNKQKN